MNKLFGIVIVSVSAAVLSMGAAIGTMIHENRTLKKLNNSLEKVQDLSEEKITDQMISKAINKAADKKVDAYMQETEEAVLRTASRSLNDVARAAVEKEADMIREKAAEKVSQQVAELDIERLKSRVCDQAEKHVLQKLDGCLDASAKKFQQHLDSAEKVYEGIAKAAAEKRLHNEDPFHIVLI